VGTAGGGARTNRGVPLLNRLRCFFAAHYLEAVDARLKGSPHRQLAAMLHDVDVDILEVCAATGFLSRIVATEFPHAKVSALDLSAEMITGARVRARGLPNLDFVEGDATTMPYPDSSFDVVLAAFGLSALSPPARGRCLAEIHRVLKASGRLLVVDIDDAVHRAGLLHACLNLMHRRRASGVAGSGLVRQVESRGFRPSRHLNGQGGLFPFQMIVAQRAAGTGDA
jgi:SAM-dependent methyltransferase